MSQSIVQSLRRWDPDWIGPFAIIGRLGAGAMGQVYLARSTAGRLVAVKTIRVELAEEPGFRARFAREVAAARRVSGVFTAAVVEADPEADLPWLATAYVPAPSLSTLVRKCGPLPVPAVRWLAAGCAEALASIHNAGLLHRDVKPSNVLVAPDGPRVIDFGVARAAERVQLTVTRGAPGTPAYMAPEQARDSSQASPASDVFSLGATLVFAATGHAPYQGEAVMDILVRLATEPPDLAGVPPELTELVAGCLQRVPRDRPTTGAILTRLGPFAAASEQAGTGHSYLPDSAMALIAEYQQHPRLAGRAGAEAAGAEAAGADGPGEATDDGSGVVSAPGDDTSGSHTALPGYDSVAPAPEAQGPHGAGRRRRRLPAPWGGARPAARAGERPARRRPLLWAGAAVAAAALIGAGTAIGMSLRDPGPQTAGTGQTAGPPPSSSSCTSPGQSSMPQVCVSQPYGDGDTVYVIHGSGFPPFSPVTVRLVGVGVSADHPVADMQGTFNYAIDQGHYFFRGPIPPKTYIVEVTGSGGRTASVSFVVHPPAAGQPPGGSPGSP
ncbi:MAG TPA: serine/threonine-protein kinase [Trebonia sp.]|nr:serine/threonine-protein kinase [Trebonia sp.]